MASTLYDKLWQQHYICDLDGGSQLLYVDLHLLHEVTSPQAFAGLTEKGRTVRRPDKTYATMDHNVSTLSRSLADASNESRNQLQTLADNCEEFGITLFDLASEHQGIVHVIGPELGLTQPGKLIVCGDSHTSTHGAFGALAFGIGTSEVEHVLATQTLQQSKAGNMLIRVEGLLGQGVSAKDLALYLIGQLGTAGGTGFVVEFQGEAIQALTMEGRMTLCNMSIEMGAKAGLIAPDQVTFDYLKGRRYLTGDWQQNVLAWSQLNSDKDAHFDKVVVFDAAKVKPQITWGTSPEQVIDADALIPIKQTSSHEYMGLEPKSAWQQVKVDQVFIGSCTNARIEDLRAAASMIKGRRVKQGLRAIVVPGSLAVKRQAEVEGLEQQFLNAGFEWREPGCSMCLAMNDDKLAPGERCASTSNRNFEGRQGRGGRTHLVSPQMAAAAAIYGHFVDVSQLLAQSEQHQLMEECHEA